MQLDIVGDVYKCTLFGLLLYCCHGNTNCLLVAKNLIFNSETVVKSVKCARLLPNGHPGTIGTYNLPSGDQNFKQGTRTGA